MGQRVGLIPQIHGSTENDLINHVDIDIKLIQYNNIYPEKDKYIHTRRLNFANNISFYF